MKDNGTETLFRKKTIERINSPEQLADYLRVTNPGVWVILTAIILLLVGIFFWASIGQLETKKDAKVVIMHHTGQVIINGSQQIEAGMPLRIAEQEYVISSVKKDEYGRTIGYAEVTLPDGTYDAEVVTDQTRPIEFLLGTAS